MRRMHIALGFNIFLEHLLPYERIEEKGRMASPPTVQLGGGAWNIAKTLEALGVPRRDMSVISLSSRTGSADRAAIDFLLQRERIPHLLLPAKDRAFSSYYLLPARGRVWAFGDAGGAVRGLSATFRGKLKREGRRADLRVVAEIGDDSRELLLARLFLGSRRGRHRSVLIPSAELLRSGNIRSLYPLLDVLAFNEEEGAALFKRPVRPGDLLRIPVETVLLTRGPQEAWCKVGGHLYAARPRPIRKPPYPGGAGDAALAAFLWMRFWEKADPERALNFAMTIGRRTLLVPTPYFQSGGRRAVSGGL
ncbi:hypothetical protein HY573_02260 [Candidatus Parcubacteria bacterium]|nr:hypothetical protein [Candidatus Parcubacteria bacterium]MBI4385629.1 hypothetical protein [Candidatus Parcubacteria bacterium]